MNLEAFLSRLARRIIPTYAQTPKVAKAVVHADLLLLLFTVPLTVITVWWLARVSDLAIIRTHGLLLALSLGLLFLFERLSFQVNIEIRANMPASAGGSLEGVIGWSLVLLAGETALWCLIVTNVVRLVRDLNNTRRLPADLLYSSREMGYLNRTRQFAVDVSQTALPVLVVLPFYRGWGGQIPLPDVALPNLALAMLAIVTAALLSVPIMVPYVWYIGQSAALGSNKRSLFGLFLTATILPFLTDPFSILLAGLYTVYGLPTYLFVLGGLILVALLAFNLSQQTLRSQQRSRELERLESLGRALIAAPPDGSGLEALLSEHVPGMFAFGKMEVWLFPARLVVNFPPQATVSGQVAVEWLQRSPESYHFPLNVPLPWSGERNTHPLNLVPIWDLDSRTVIGGIYLARGPNNRVTREVLPAMQSLAAQITSAVHGAFTYRQAIANQRMVQELALAGQIQATFLPNALPSVQGWQLAVTLEPARQTSGDFYDLLDLPDGKIGIVVADVADKGVGAALYMALSRTLIRTFAMQYPDHPAQALTAANRRILMDTHAELFVTVFYAVLDPRSGSLTYCSAGHNPAFLLSGRDEGCDHLALGRTGIPLGMFEESVWREATVQLAPLDVLVAYTDGLTEAQTDAQTDDPVLYGEERLLTAIRRSLAGTAEDVQTAILADVRNFTGGAPQFDDITLLVLMRR
jgi:serine phosphatase RsbU (regulator of sigma subunit)